MPNIQHLLLMVIAITSFSISANTVKKPNIVIMIADDISAQDIALYGHATIKTPNIDKLASEAVTFDNAYLTVSSCSPSRSSILTGRYPHNTGAPELHSELPDTTILLPKLLKDNGYFTAQAGKWHIGTKAPKFTGMALTAFDVYGGSGSDGGGKSGSEVWVKRLQERPKDKPFFMWFAAHDAHRKWDNSKAPLEYKLEDVIVAPYQVDNQATREDYLGYYREVSRFDYYVGEVIKELKQQQLFDNTLVIVMADNGRPFPRDKTHVYDSGIKTPFVVSWPKTQQAGSRSKSLVSAIDIAPTIMELAGLKSPVTFQGRSFTNVLKEPHRPFRNYVFAERNWHLFSAHERMVRHQNYVYIENSYPQFSIFLNKEVYPSGSGKSLLIAYKNGTLTAEQDIYFQAPRPQAELYDIDKDPLQLTNLAQLPLYKNKVIALAKVLEQWRQETGDSIPKIITPDNIVREHGSRKKGTPWKRGEMPGESNNATMINAPGPF